MGGLNGKPSVLLARPDLLRVSRCCSLASFIVIASILRLRFHLPFVPHSGAFRSDEHILSTCSST